MRHHVLLARKPSCKVAHLFVVLAYPVQYQKTPRYSPYPFVLSIQPVDPLEVFLGGNLVGVYFVYMWQRILDLYSSSWGYCDGLKKIGSEAIEGLGLLPGIRVRYD